MKSRKVLCLTSAGAALLIIGITLPVLLPLYRDHKLDQTFVLRADSKTFSSFVEPPVTFYRHFYFFNVTNPKEILKGEQPRVVEIGPFVYTEKKRRVNILFNDLEDTLTFQMQNTFNFQPQLSGNLTEDTKITTINAVMIALASMAENSAYSELAQGMLQIILLRFRMDPFVTHTAGELLFQGYKEDLISEIAPFTDDATHYTGRFGFFYPKNQSLEATEKIHTGVRNISELMQIVEYNGEKKLKTWEEEKCNELKGTVAAPLPRPVIKETNFYMYSPGLCRSVYFTFDEILQVSPLERVYRYIVPYSLLENSEENACFCTDKFTCRPSMAYLAACSNGAPMVASYPHFYMCDEKDVNAVHGINPEPEKHKSYVDVEPVTGMFVGARKRVQANMPLKRYANLPVLQNVRELVFPILWMDQSVDVPDDILNEIYYTAILSIDVATYVCHFLALLGTLMIILATILSIINTKRRNDERINHRESNACRMTMADIDSDTNQMLMNGFTRNSNAAKINITRDVT